MLRIAAEFQGAYLRQTSPFMVQVHVPALRNDFLANYAELVRSWANRSRATVEAWIDLEPDGKCGRAAHDRRSSARAQSVDERYLWVSSSCCDPRS